MKEINDAIKTYLDRALNTAPSYGASFLLEEEIPSRKVRVDLEFSDSTLISLSEMKEAIEAVLDAANISENYDVIGRAIIVALMRLGISLCYVNAEFSFGSMSSIVTWYSTELNNIRIIEEI